MFSKRKIVKPEPPKRSFRPALAARKIPPAAAARPKKAFRGR